MPALDRRITVRVASTAFNSFGEPVPTTTDYPVWAMLVQDKLARNVAAGGIYALADRVWRVRFDRRFLEAHAAGETVSVIVPGLAGEDNPDIVTGVGEPARVNRRRFLDLLT